MKMNGKWEARPHKDSINRFKEKAQEINISFVVSVYELQDTETKSGDKRMDKLF